MANATGKKKIDNFSKLRGEFYMLEKNMLGLEEKLGSVERDKEALRRFNQVLVEKLKTERARNQPFQMFLLKKELETERELRLLSEEKLVMKQSTCDVLQDHFAQLMNENLVEYTAKDEKRIDSLEGSKKAMEEENATLKTNIENLIQSEEGLKKELKQLKNDNKELVAIEFAKSFTDQIMIESLQEIIVEEEEIKRIDQQKIQNSRQRLVEENDFLKKKTEHLIQNEECLKRELEELREKNEDLVFDEFAISFGDQMMIESLKEIIEERENANGIEKRNLQEELQYAQEQIALIFDIEQRAILTEATMKDQLRIIDEKDEEILKEKEKSEILAKQNNHLEDAVMALEEKLRDTEQALAKSDESFEGLSLKIEEFTNDVSEWKFKAELAEAECHSKEDKITILEARANSVQLECNRMQQNFIEECKKHTNKIVSLSFDVGFLQNQREDFLGEILMLENNIEKLTNKIDILNKQGEKVKGQRMELEDEKRDLLGKNEEMNELNNKLSQKIMKYKRNKWWRRIVSCS